MRYAFVEKVPATYTILPLSYLVIHFHYEAPSTIQEVYLVGSFNNWDITKDPMVFRKAEGTTNIFDVCLELYSGLYYYKFYLPASGEYRQDPMNPNRANDTFGGYNSVLEIPVGESVSFVEMTDLDSNTAQTPSSAKCPDEGGRLVGRICALYTALSFPFLWKPGCTVFFQHASL